MLNNTTRINKKRVLIFVPMYLPGYKAGGPIRTVENLVEQLGDLFDFYVLTTDRDLGDNTPYEGIKAEEWIHVGKAKVYYMPPERQKFEHFIKAIKSVNTDCYFFNSFFSSKFTILPLVLRRFGHIPKVPFIVAPRGEFASSALALSSLKKKIFLRASKILKIYHEAVWQVESEFVRGDIIKVMERDAKVVIAPDLPSVIKKQEITPRKKEKGKLNVIFLSRIARMKNLDGALQMLRFLKGEVQFSIFGPQEDQEYWEQCNATISQLPPNVHVEYFGNVEHDRVVNTIAKYDLFFLPTMGESYGYVISEAFVAGCPVLISDRTPWRGLEHKGIGWDIPLEEPERFVEILQRCIDMSDEEHRRFSGNAMEFGIQHAKSSESIRQNIEMIAGCLKATE